MAHYYTENNDILKSNPREITFMLYNQQFKMISNNGVFSKNHLDFATRLLLESFEPIKENFTFLDMGCGYGVIGIVVSKIFNISADMVDINNRAIELSKKNVELNEAKANVNKSNTFDSVEKKYDYIMTNPPIRAGKKIVYSIFEGAYEHLNDNGELWIVINKKHGADSARNKLVDIFGNVEVVNRKKGFYILKCKK